MDDLGRILNLKFDSLRNVIPLRGSHLGQGVFSDRKLFNHVRFFPGGPGLHFLALFVFDDQLRAGQFLFISDILLGDFDFGHIVLHLNLLHLNIILVFCKNHLKNDLLSGHISVRSFLLLQGIFSGIQGHRMRLIRRDPLVNHLSGLIGYAYMRAGQLL